MALRVPESTNETVNRMSYNRKTIDKKFPGEQSLQRSRVNVLW
jgi:hypothetical protein